MGALVVAAEPSALVGLTAGALPLLRACRVSFLFSLVRLHLPFGAAGLTYTLGSSRLPGWAGMPFLAPRLLTCTWQVLAGA